MSAHPPSMPPELLAERVPADLRRIWVKPRFAERPAPVPADKVEEISRAVLDAMLTRPYRVGPLPDKTIYDALLHRVRFAVKKNRPVFVSLGYGPLKNQNAVPYSRADWAEFFALCHLVTWHNKVQAIYAPGLQLRIYFDDATLAMANKADKGLMKSYIQSVAELTSVLGFDRLFLKPMCHSAFAWAFNFGPYLLAGWLVRRWERKPENQPQIEKMLEYARRNITPPAGLSPDEQEKFFRKASHRYRVYWETLQLIGVTNSWTRIVGMYLDGTQHHLPQLVALHLTTVAKGQVTQPWQGEGVLLDNGHNKLEPFVMTAGRRQRHALCLVPVGGIINMPGFDSISVAWANTEASAGAESARPVEAHQPAST
jgi:hypothetical protein